MKLNHIYNEPNLATLARMPDNFVDCIVTSPPYWGLRDYGHADQLGLEETPEAYVANMVAVFRECRRVLKETGSLWLNLGDSYAGGGGFSPGAPTTTESKSGKYGLNGALKQGGIKPQGLIKPKDLCGIPWRVAFALQADGWYLRSDIIWSKPNPMPESVTDRPTKAHEYIFLLTKNSRYFYDAEAVKEKSADPIGSANRYKSEFGGDKSNHLLESGQVRTRPIGSRDFDGTRNRRTVWTVPTRSYTGAHFAVFPPDLIKPCVLAGSPEKVCECCGKVWERVVEREALPVTKRSTINGGGHSSPQLSKRGDLYSESKTTGFRPTCTCPDSTGSAKGIVYDPFGGSGTTAEVAATYGRNWILSEINPEYVKLAEERLAFTAQMQMF